MAIHKLSRLEKKANITKSVKCKRCGARLSGDTLVKGFSVICPRCRRPT